jgi:CHAD domain-containing protein
MRSLLFDLSAQRGLDAVSAWIQSRFSAQLAESGTLIHSYLDTFDWRVYAAAGVLELMEGKAGKRLLWRSLGGSEVYFNQQIDTVPRFAWDLPQGRLRERLGPILDVRALLAMVTSKGRIRVFHVLNEDEKTVLRVELREERVVPGKTRAGDLGQTLQLLPVRGYESELEHAIRRLKQGLGASKARRDPLESSLEAIGRRPGDYSSKLHVPLRADERSDAGAKEILSRLLHDMLANEDGVRQDLDSEFLHDFRVAVRRTRSLLGQVKGIFPAQRVERFRREFAWLGQITSPLRDMHVYLLSFDTYKASLPEAQREGLMPLKGFLERHRDQEHRALVQGLGSVRYRRLIKDWRAFLEADAPRHSSLPNAMRPVLEVASERLWKVYKRVLKEGHAIGPDTPAPALHELRKTCKKLRYLMEFFRSLYPQKQIGQLIKALKGFQDNLGLYQDLHVQQESLIHFRQQMQGEGMLTPATEQAMGLLIKDLERRQHQVREEFAQRFARFSAKGNRHRFRHLFRREVDTTAVAA